ncbi:MAG: glycine cleavage system aminomethyltransferase GcvT [Candidatus Actinomarina sp.]|jgi:aminomethyltransferase
MDKRTTHLHSFHESKNAKFIDFGDWSMPFSYEGTLKEHDTVRSSSGFFDVSHMGRLEIDYSELDKISSLICSDLINIPTNKALYSIFTNENGNALDDVIFWKFEDKFILIPNASNASKIKSHLTDHKIDFIDKSLETVLIAVQGPKTIELINDRFEIPEKFSTAKSDNFMYARTGYTGEDGIEIMASNAEADSLISFLIEKGIKPCGLGSRDTLRLEASLPLYGFELTEDITPVEASLSWTITNELDFLGSERIKAQLEDGNHKSLKKFTIESRKIARTETIGMAGDISGVVTSGNFSPILNKSIGFILFENKPSQDLIEFDIRGNLIEGNIVNKRFLS